MSFKDSEFHHVKGPATCSQPSPEVVANAAKKEDIEKTQSLLWDFLEAQSFCLSLTAQSFLEVKWQLVGCSRLALELTSFPSTGVYFLAHRPYQGQRCDVPM